MKTALFLDFDDSFSYNVLQELNYCGLEVDIIKWFEFSGDSQHDLLVLGPGPGHPDDYKKIFPLIEGWLHSNKKIFSICLGHQIVSRILGFEVSKSKYPVHGQKVQLELDEFWQNFLHLPEKVMVQRYNSLAVTALETSAFEDLDMLFLNGEIMISRSSHLLSYQFHPESVGTKCRQSFFRPILTDLL
jgi:anthranilate synthase component 2